MNLRTIVPSGRSTAALTNLPINVIIFLFIAIIFIIHIHCHHINYSFSLPSYQFSFYLLSFILSFILSIFVATKAISIVIVIALRCFGFTSRGHLPLSHQFSLAQNPTSQNLGTQKEYGHPRFYFKLSGGLPARITHSWL